MMNTQAPVIKRFPIITVLLVGLALASTLAGCGDDDGANDNDAAVDASSGDASTVDSAVVADSAVPDAEVPLLETIEVVDMQGNALPLANVFTSDDTGAVVDTYVADVLGTVQVDVPEGGTVTAAYVMPGGGSFPDFYVMSTAVGLADGGTFRATLMAWSTTTAPAPMTIGMTIDASPAGTTHYSVHIECYGTGFSTNSGVMTGFDGCGNTDPYDIVVYALDAADNRLGYGYLFDQPFQEGAVVTHTLSATHTDLESVDFTASAILAGAEDVDMSAAGIRAGSPETVTRDSDYVSFPGASETVTLYLPASVLDSFVLYSSVFLEDTAVLRRSRYYHSEHTTWPQTVHWDTTVTADVVALGLPDLTDLQRPVISWALDPSGTSGDGLEHSLSWGNANNGTQWTIHTPVQTSGTVQLPDLPLVLEAAELTSATDLQGVSLMHYEQHTGDAYQSYLAAEAWTERWFTGGYRPLDE